MIFKIYMGKFIDLFSEIFYKTDTNLQFKGIFFRNIGLEITKSIINSQNQYFNCFYAITFGKIITDSLKILPIITKLGEFLLNG